MSRTTNPTQLFELCQEEYSRIPKFQQHLVRSLWKDAYNVGFESESLKAMLLNTNTIYGELYSGGSSQTKNCSHYPGIL